MRAAIQRRRENRWPPPTPISEDGRLAGLTTTGCVTLSAAVWLTVAFQVDPVHPGLPSRTRAWPDWSRWWSPTVLVAAAAMGWVILGRPTDPDPGIRTGWVLGLSVIFTLGVIAAASGIPQPDVPRRDDAQFLRLLRRAGRQPGSPAAEYAWLRHIVDVVGVVIGFTVIRSRRWVGVSAPIAATVWLGGTGALLARTLLRS